MPDLPDNCLGNELSDRCIYHEDTGESVQDIINRLDSTSPETSDSTVLITSDDVISNSLVRSVSVVCSSKIVNREISYTITVGPSTSMFSWTLLDFISKLPSGYTAATFRVKATGKGVGSNKVLFDSSSKSAGYNIPLDQYPVSIDFSVRVTSPCGDIDLTKTISLLSPTPSGTKLALLNAKDLVSGNDQGLVLTEQLDSMEFKLDNLSGRFDEFETVEINGFTNTIPNQVVEHSAELDALWTKINDPSEFIINYVNALGNSSDELSDLFTKLYARIESLESTLIDQNIEIQNLQAQVDSLNALS